MIKWLSASLWITGAVTFIRMLEFSFWINPSTKKLRFTIPQLLINFIHIVMLATVAITVMNRIFGLSVAGILTASGAAGVVIGLASQGMIADIFAGFAVSSDKTLRIDDWIRIDRGGSSPLIGCVHTINWRTIRLTTTDGVMIIVPNNFLITNVITNLSLPEERSRFEHDFVLDFTVPSDRVIRIMSAALEDTHGILKNPAPKVKISAADEKGVTYRVKYWTIPREFSPAKARSAVIGNVLHHLHHAGISLSYPKMDLYQSSMPSRQLNLTEDKKILAGRIDLFKSLPSDEIARIAEFMNERLFHKGEMVVCIGDPGNSMFVIVEGLLDVMLPDATKKDAAILVGRLAPGNFFGEMSLLIGESRSASVIAATDSLLLEIPGTGFKQILQNHPEIAENLSNEVAKRRLANEKAVTLSGLKEEQIAGISKSILSKIKAFFSI